MRNDVVLSEPGVTRFGAFSPHSGSPRAEAIPHGLRALLGLKYESAPRAEHVVGRRIVRTDGRIWIVDRFDQLSAVLRTDFHAGILARRVFCPTAYLNRCTVAVESGRDPLWSAQ